MSERDLRLDLYTKSMVVIAEQKMPDPTSGILT